VDKVGAVAQFHFDPDSYLELMHAEVPRYEELQDETARVCDGVEISDVLELGVGTGETARRVLARHPAARLVGLDESERMLARAREVVPEAELVAGRLEDPLPDGPFDLVVSALAVHHLDAAAKRDLFARVARVLRPGGRFVLADVVVPDDPADAVTPLSSGFDLPDRAVDQLFWLSAAGFTTRTGWAAGDLAVLVADLPPTADAAPSSGRGKAATDA
jgi:tRNA (cmo5U34)-methyltransferase